MSAVKWRLTVDDYERNVILDALELAANSEGWDQEERELAERLHDDITNDRQRG